MSVKAGFIHKQLASRVQRVGTLANWNFSTLEAIVPHNSDFDLVGNRLRKIVQVTSSEFSYFVESSRPSFFCLFFLPNFGGPVFGN